MVGSDVTLSCVYPEGDRFDLDDLFVYWQVSESHVVVTYYLPGNSSMGLEDSHYKNRAYLSRESMQRGDFSLQLRNVTPGDEQKFKCLVIRSSSGVGRILEAEVTLHVAGKAAEPSTDLIQPRVPRRRSQNPSPSPAPAPFGGESPVVVTAFFFAREASGWKRGQLVDGSPT